MPLTKVRINKTTNVLLQKAERQTETMKFNQKTVAKLMVDMTGKEPKVILLVDVDDKKISVGGSQQRLHEGQCKEDLGTTIFGGR